MRNKIVRKKVSIIGSSLAALAMTSAAQADDLKSFRDFTTQNDLSLSVSDGKMVGDATHLKNMTLIRGGVAIVAGDVYLSGMGVSLRGVLLQKSAGSSGSIRMDAMTLSDYRELNILFPSDETDFEDDITDTSLPESLIEFTDCADLKDQEERLVEMSLLNLRMTGDIDAMPVDIDGAEKITASTVNAKKRYFRDGEQCQVDTEMSAPDLIIHSIDGDRLLFQNVEAGLEVSVNEIELSSDQKTRFSADRSLLIHKDNSASVRSGALDIAWWSDENWSNFICAVDAGDIGKSTFTDAFSMSKAGVSVEIENLFIDVEAFVPDYLREALALGDTDQIDGDIRFEMSLADGQGQGDIDIQIPQFLTLVASAQMGFPAGEGSSLPAFISAKVPVPSEILDVEISHLDVSYSDHGFGKLVEAVTGETPKNHFMKIRDLSLVRLESKIPEFLVSKVRESGVFFEDFLEFGGEARIAPEKPVTIMSLVMQGVLSPDKLADTLGVRAVVHRKAPEKRVIDYGFPQ